MPVPERRVEERRRNDHPRNDVEPEQDHRRRAERTVHLRRTPELGREVQDDDQLKSLLRERQEAGAGKQRAKRSVGVRQRAEREGRYVSEFVYTRPIPPATSTGDTPTGARHE